MYESQIVKLLFLALEKHKFKMSSYSLTSYFHTCALSEGVTVHTGWGAAMALLILNNVTRWALLHTLLIMQEERLVTAQAVSAVFLTRCTIGCTADTQLAFRITPAEIEADIMM